MSPSEFNGFINEAHTQVSNLRKGVKLGNTRFSMFIYADDMALFAESANDLQLMGTVFSTWLKSKKLLLSNEKDPNSPFLSQNSQTL